MACRCKRFTVKIKKLDENAVVPQYAQEGDAGADLTLLEDVSIYPNGVTLCKTGIAIELPIGYEAQIRSRSGLALKRNIFVLNSPGTVDEGYRGEVGVILCNVGGNVQHLKAGDRIAQMVIKPVEQANFEVVDELSETSRGTGGFGSTGTEKQLGK